MASFGGSGWPAGSQQPTASPFASNPFSSTPKQSPFSSSPFGATAGSQNNGSSVPHNPFGATPSANAASHPNPFAKKASPNAPAVKNPFAAGAAAGKPSPPAFGAKDAGSTFGGSSFGNERSPSPFSMPPKQGRSNSPGNAARPNPFGAPSKLHAGPNASSGGNRTSGKRFGAASDAEEHSGSDASTSSKRTKRSKRQRDDTGPKTNGVKGGPIPAGSKSNAQAGFSSKPVPTGPKSGVTNGFGAGRGAGKAQFGQPTNGPSRPGGRLNAPTPPRLKPTPAEMKSKGRESANMNDPYAKKIMDQLARDGVRPPTWPAEPGNPSNKNTMMAFRDEYKEYRDRARASLVKAGLIDDPEDRKRLEDALDFKGISEDMSPEFENVTRITEFDVKQAEKDPDTSWPDTSRMVKKLARSAAGQEAPLPMDVRSVPALRRTIDYLINDLLQSDDNLPHVHGFLWDRTRAIRRDFAFFSTMTPDEMRDQVYCLETIARFHVTSLHLLSQKDLKPEDFSEQQEVEQLGKTLISLMYAYNDCNAQGITCENEAEFRAYQLVFRAYHSDVLEIVQREWDAKLWMESDDIRTAVSLVEALQNTQDFHGPLKGGPSFAAAGTYYSYFRIVEDPSVSFTMACFAEIHFGQLRRSILAAVKKAYSRPKQIAKDVTAAVLNSYLRFDDVEEAIEFAEYHGLGFAPDGDDPDDIEKSYVILEYGTGLEYERLHHKFSATIVESKRSSHTLPEVIQRTVFGDLATKPAAAVAGDSRPMSQPSEPKQTQQPLPSAFSQASPFGDSSQAPKTGGIFSSTTATPPAGFGAPTPAAQPKDTPAFTPQPPAPSPFGGQATTPAASQPPTPSIFSQPSTAPATGIFGQPAPPAAQQPTPAPPTPSLFFKPPEPTKTLAATFHQPTSSSDAEPPLPAFSFPSTAEESGTAALPAFQATPTAGVPSPSTTTPASQPTTTPSISQPPSFFPKSPATQAPAARHPEPTPAVSQPLPTPATPAAPPAQAPSVPPPTKEDRMAQFVEWYVKGDSGLLEQFQIFLVEEAVRKVYEQHVKDEKERIRKEEDEKSWAEARKFRTYNLGVKYFYRWRETARQNRASALRRGGRDQVREYHEAKRAERLKQREEAARLQRRLARQGRSTDNVAELTDLIKRRSQDMQETRDALLESGVLSGVTDEQGAAARIAEDNRSSPGVSSSGRMSPPPPPRRRAGLPSFVHRIKTGLSEGVNKIRPSGGGAKTRALRAEFSGSALSRSLARSTSRSSLPPSSSESPVSRVSGRWRLKAMGLTTMPDGSVLPDRLARSVMREGNRYPELGNFGLDGRRRASDVGVRPSTMDGTFSPDPGRWTSHGRGSALSVGGEPTQKRKRDSEDFGTSESEGRDGKRILLDTEKTIREMRRLREEMEEGTGWFREQNERLRSRSRTGTGTSVDGGY